MTREDLIRGIINEVLLTEGKWGKLAKAGAVVAGSTILGLGAGALAGAARGASGQSNMMRDMERARNGEGRMTANGRGGLIFIPNTSKK